MDTTDVGIGTDGIDTSPPTGDFYATGDARVPNVLGGKKGKKPIKRKLNRESKFEVKLKNLLNENEVVNNIYIDPDTFTYITHDAHLTLNVYEDNNITFIIDENGNAVYSESEGLTHRDLRFKENKNIIGDFNNNDPSIYERSAPSWSNQLESYSRASSDYSNDYSNSNDDFNTNPYTYNNTIYGRIYFPYSSKFPYTNVLTFWNTNSQFNPKQLKTINIMINQLGIDKPECGFVTFDSPSKIKTYKQFFSNRTSERSEEDVKNLRTMHLINPDKKGDEMKKAGIVPKTPIPLNIKQKALPSEGFSSFYDEIINEKTDSISELIRKTLKEEGLQYKIALSFGTGVTGLWNPIYELLIKYNPELTIKDCILIFVSIFSFFFLKDKDTHSKLIDILKERNLFKTQIDLKKQFKLLVKKISIAVDDFSEVSAYTSAFVPLWDMMMKFYASNDLSIHSLYSILLGFGLSTSILGFRNFIKHYFSKETTLKEAYFVKFHSAYWLNPSGQSLTGKHHWALAKDYLKDQSLNLHSAISQMESLGFTRVEIGDESIYLDVKTINELSSSQKKWVKQKQDDILIDTGKEFKIRNIKGKILEL